MTPVLGSAEEEREPNAPPERAEHSSFAQRRPWAFSAVWLLIGLVVGGVVENRRDALGAKPLGVPTTVGGVTITPKDFQCVDVKDEPRQVCTITYLIRNNTNSTMDPTITSAVFVGGNRYDGGYLSDGSIFPGERQEVTVDYEVPGGVSPDKLRFEGEQSFLEFVLPFYSSVRWYNLG